MHYLILVITLLFPAIAHADMEECRTLYFSQKPEAYMVCYPLAAEKDSEAMKIVGDMYYWGWGDEITQDYQEAVLWYKRAASAGNIEAKYNLGVLYEQGQGIAIDYVRAAKWYLSAAKDGHVNAQFNIANMYTKGAGIKKNEFSAVKWYLRAANQGEVISQYNLGNRYARGEGVSQDLEEAYKWYILAEKQGDVDAHRNRILLEESMTHDQMENGRRRANRWKSVAE